MKKKDRDKRFIKNWRPISKALAARLKDILPKIISSEQSAYVKNRFIGENGRLISDIIEVADLFNIEDYVVTMDIEKAFDSLDYTFSIQVLKINGFGKTFIRWVETITNKQESCVVNGGNTTQYFILEKRARQGDPISAYLFVIALEVLFILIKNNSYIKRLKIFNYIFLYYVCANDTTFFVKNVDSVEEIIKIFNLFSKCSGLKPNLKLNVKFLE